MQYHKYDNNMNLGVRRKEREKMEQKRLLYYNGMAKLSDKY